MCVVCWCLRDDAGISGWMGVRFGIKKHIRDRNSLVRWKSPRIVPTQTQSFSLFLFPTHSLSLPSPTYIKVMSHRLVGLVFHTWYKPSSSSSVRCVGGVVLEDYADDLFQHHRLARYDRVKRHHYETSGKWLTQKKGWIEGGIGKTIREMKWQTQRGIMVREGKKFSHDTNNKMSVIEAQRNMWGMGGW